VTVDAATWRTVVAVGSGRTVGDLGGDLELGEVAVSRAVKQLVEMGLAELALIDETVLAEMEAAEQDDAASVTTSARAELDAMVAEYPPAEADVEVDRAVDAEVGDADADEVARQLAALSPKAARAVAAAAHAATDEERDAALAEVQSEGGDQINRGMLLRFLSSVKS
jgi:DNA-binding MarR family transcriptional regulator